MRVEDPFLSTIPLFSLPFHRRLLVALIGLSAAGQHVRLTVTHSYVMHECLCEQPKYEMDPRVKELQYTISAAQSCSTSCRFGKDF